MRKKMRKKREKRKKKAMKTKKKCTVTSQTLFKTANKAQRV